MGDAGEVEERDTPDNVLSRAIYDASSITDQLYRGSQGAKDGGGRGVSSTPRYASLSEKENGGEEWTVRALAQGLLSYGFLLAHVASFLDPIGYKTYKRHKKQSFIFVTKARSDLRKMCVLSKSFNWAMVINEPIWQNVLETVFSPAITVHAPCGALEDKTALYKIVCGSDANFSCSSSSSFLNSGLFESEIVRKTRVSFSDFLNSRRILKHALFIGNSLGSSGLRLMKRNDKRDTSNLSQVDLSHIPVENAELIDKSSMSCIFCMNSESIKGDLVSLFLNESNDNINVNIFPTFDELPKRCFSAICSNCSFRIDVSFLTMVSACEAQCHEDFLFDGIFNVGAEEEEEEDDIIPIMCDFNTSFKLTCQRCRGVCEEDGCNKLVCFDFYNACEYCEKEPLCVDHILFCEEENCETSLCSECCSCCARCENRILCLEHMQECGNCGKLYCFYCIDSFGVCEGVNHAADGQLSRCTTIVCLTCSSICEFGKCDKELLCDLHSKYCERCDRIYCTSCIEVVQYEKARRKDGVFSTCSICTRNSRKLTDLKPTKLR